MTIHHLDEVLEAREIREAEAERLRKAAGGATPAPFIERRRIPHDGSRRTVATGIVTGQDAQVTLAGSRAAAKAIRSGLLAGRRRRAAERAAATGETP